MAFIYLSNQKERESSAGLLHKARWGWCVCVRMRGVVGGGGWGDVETTAIAPGRSCEKRKGEEQRERICTFCSDQPSSRANPTIPGNDLTLIPAYILTHMTLHWTPQIHFVFFELRNETFHLRLWHVLEKSCKSSVVFQQTFGPNTLLIAQLRDSFQTFNPWIDTLYFVWIAGWSVLGREKRDSFI